MDFSKAFDSLDHDLLVSKLGKLGLSGPILAWFMSYFHYRKQQVVLGGHFSDWSLRYFFIIISFMSIVIKFILSAISCII